MKPHLSATSEEPTLSTASAVTKPKQQPSVTGDDSAPVGWVTVLKLAEPSPADPQAGPEEGPEESPEENPEENPAETKLDSEDWLRPSPGSPLPESGEVWVNGEDNDHAVSLAEVTAVDPSFEEKRKHILAACLRGESNFDYDGLSPLGAHCCKQLVIWLQTSDRNQWNLEDANLRGANLARANLKDVDLSGVTLYLANLTAANLEGANLGGANLRGAHLGGANLGGANLTGADLGGANLRAVNLKDVDLTGVNLNGADLNGASDADRLSEDQRKVVNFVS